MTLKIRLENPQFIIQIVSKWCKATLWCRFFLCICFKEGSDTRIKTSYRCDGFLV